MRESTSKKIQYSPTQEKFSLKKLNYNLDLVNSSNSNINNISINNFHDTKRSFNESGAFPSSYFNNQLEEIERNMK